MEIRSERPSDVAAISAVITAAFLEVEHSGGNEAEIVAALRDAGSLAVSLVAVENDRILGHVALSPVAVDGRDEGWFGLAPVAVLPQHQRKGIGRALIEAGLATLREKGAPGCVVLGDPAYYGRFGFEADPAFYLEGVPPEYFQRLSLGAAARGGRVNFHPAFGVG
jgi:putative acetyltransferase